MKNVEKAKASAAARESKTSQNGSPKGVPKDSEEALRARLKLLVDRSSQSEIARKAGVSVANVNHYLNGTRVPANFCQALVSNAGVNPAWLLTGEGAPFLAEVSAATGKMAGDMLELVEAMTAVERMKLGALTGKEQLKTLRQLNDALLAYEHMRERLNDQARPVLKDITASMRKALSTFQYDKASELRKAAAQVSRFCDDADLLRELRTEEGTLEYMAGDIDRALTIKWEVFLRGLLARDVTSEASCTAARDFVMALHGNSYYGRARIIGRASIELFREHGARWDSYHQLNAVLGFLDVNLGEIRRGLPRLLNALPRTQPGFQRTAGTAMLLQAMLHAGTLTFEQADHEWTVTRGSSFHLLRYACFREDAGILKRAAQRYIADDGDHAPPTSLPAIWAKTLLAFLEAGDDPVDRAAAGLRELERLEPGYVVPPAHSSARVYHLSLIRAQTARMCGDYKACARHTEQVEKIAQTRSQESHTALLTQAVHYHNALFVAKTDETRALGPGLALRAREFYMHHVKKGYACLAPVLPEIGGAGL